MPTQSISRSSGLFFFFLHDGPKKCKLIKKINRAKSDCTVQDFRKKFFAFCSVAICVENLVIFFYFYAYVFFLLQSDVSARTCLEVLVEV